MKSMITENDMIDVLSDFDHMSIYESMEEFENEQILSLGVEL